MRILLLLSEDFQEINALASKKQHKNQIKEKNDTWHYLCNKQWWKQTEPDPNHKMMSLPLHNCGVAAVLICNAIIWLICKYWYVTLAKGSQPTGCGLLRGKRTSLNLWHPACEMLGLLACGHRSLLVCVLQIKPRASAELQFSDLSLFSLKRCSCLYRRTLAGVPYEISWVTPIVHADLSIPE